MINFALSCVPLRTFRPVGPTQTHRAHAPQRAVYIYIYTSRSIRIFPYRPKGPDGMPANFFSTSSLTARRGQTECSPIFFQPPPLPPGGARRDARRFFDRLFSHRPSGQTECCPFLKTRTRLQDVPKMAYPFTPTSLSRGFAPHLRGRAANPPFPLPLPLTTTTL